MPDNGARLGLRWQNGRGLGQRPERSTHAIMSREYPDRPHVGVGVVVLRGDSVLLVRRAKPPRVGSWSLPGGGQELGETVFEAGRREIAEETGLTVEIGRDRRRGRPHRMRRGSGERPGTLALYADRRGCGLARW